MVRILRAFLALLPFFSATAAFLADLTAFFLLLSFFFPLAYGRGRRRETGRKEKRSKVIEKKNIAAT